MSKLYDVTLPFAGHIYVQVEADSQEDAIEKALDNATLKDVEDWEAMKKFHQGNVCYCPTPWESKAVLAIGEEEDE